MHGINTQCVGSWLVGHTTFQVSFFLAMGSGKKSSPPTCRKCSGYLIGIDANLCPKCSVRYCSICRGGVYTIDPVTKVESKKCSSCGDSSGDESETNAEEQQRSFMQLFRTHRHSHAEERRRQEDQLLAKHKEENAKKLPEPVNPNPSATRTPHSRGIARLITRRKPKPTNVEVEVEEGDPDPEDLDNKLGFWEGRDTESSVTTDPKSRFNIWVGNKNGVGRGVRDVDTANVDTAKGGARQPQGTIYQDGRRMSVRLSRPSIQPLAARSTNVMNIGPIRESTQGQNRSNSEYTIGRTASSLVQNSEDPKRRKEKNSVRPAAQTLNGKAT